MFPDMATYPLGSGGETALFENHCFTRLEVDGSPLLAGKRSEKWKPGGGNKWERSPSCLRAIMFFHVLGPRSRWASVNTRLSGPSAATGKSQQPRGCQGGAQQLGEDCGVPSCGLLPYKCLPLESPWTLVLNLGHTISGSHSHTF